MAWNRNEPRALERAARPSEATEQKEKFFPWETVPGRGGARSWRGGARSYSLHSSGPAAGLIHEAAQPCAFCRGSGLIHRWTKCPVCRGQGTVVHSRTPLVVCAFCRGHGQKPLRSTITCGSCRGRGFVTVVEPVEVCPACRGRGCDPGNSNMYCTVCRGAGVVTVKSDQVRHVSLGGSERDLAEALLDKGPMGKWALGREIGVSSNYAAFLCKAMLRRGSVKELGGGLYDLAPGVRKALEVKREQPKREQEVEGERRPREQEPEREQAPGEQGQIGPWAMRPLR